MAVPAGIDISVTFAAGYTTKVTSISLNFSAAALDTTGAGETSDFDTVTGGRRKLAGSFAAKWDTTLNYSGSSTTGYQGLGGTGSEATFTFSSGGANVVVPIVVTGIDVTANIDSAHEVAFTFEANGAPTARAFA